MVFRLASLTLVTLLVSLSTVAHAAPRDARLRRVHSWAFAIGSGNLSGNVARRYAPFDLVVVDGEEATTRQVALLRRAHKLVLGYLDVGTIEAGRSWYGKAKPYRLDLWGDWGEWYAATDRIGYRRLIARDVAPRMLRKGFDGLFLDNTDMIESHPRQAAGMRRLAGDLSGLVHRRGGLLFTQNGEGSIGPTLRLYDGWNREDVTSTYDFGGSRYRRVSAEDRRAAQSALRRIGRHGLLTLATDYVGRGDARTTKAATSAACSAGSLPYVADIGLRRVPARAFRC
jgi:endo-alpha-1,4-polygalactosaminidase (GH114 family)